ncbi:MAG TPA: hypothetical protein PLJ44_09590 [Victivallales bacterium]|nr:hypothetical protein [Victivallales bacterium]
MKKTRVVNKRIDIIERKRIYRQKMDCRGFITDTDEVATIEIRKSLTDVEKLLTVFHELCHWIQCRHEEGQDKEKVAIAFEMMVYQLFKNYIPAGRGVIEILFLGGKK